MASPIRTNTDIEPLGDIGGLLTPREDYIPNLQSAYGAIIQNAPDYQYFTAPLSNQGRTTASYGTTNQLVVAPDTAVRLVNNATGEVVYSGSGYQGAQQAIDAANALSSSTGSKANWDIQVTRPGSTNFETVSTERPDVSGLGMVADIALPVAGSLLAGPLGLGALGLGAAGTTAAGAAIGSGLSSAAQGRSLEDALMRAAIAGGGSYLGSQLFGASPTSPTATTGGINADLIPNALKGLNFGSIATTAVPAGVGAGAGSLLPSVAGDIVVNALGSSVPAVVGSAVGSALGSVPSLINTPTYTPDEIVVTARNQPDLNLGGVLNVAPSLINPPVTTPPTTTPPTPEPVPSDEIVVTARPGTPVVPPFVPPITVPPGILPPATTPTTPTDTTPPAKKDVLGTGLTATELLAAAGLGSSLLGSLFGGAGTGGTTATPYVSPFGAGVGFGTGMDYRAQPAITDYERYGFGPEAMFFRPEYSRLVSSAAAPAQPAATTNPVYTPLI